MDSRNESTFLRISYTIPASLENTINNFFKFFNFFYIGVIYDLFFFNILESFYNSVNIIIRLMLSLMGWAKVITLSGAYCIRQQEVYDD
jgi:hypothetical protein